MKKLIAALLLVLLAVTASDARRLTGGTRSYRLKIYGYVGEKAAGVPALATWKLTADQKKLPFICDKIDVLTGNVAYFDIVRALEPYRNNAFSLKGDAVKDFTSAPAKQRIVMEGVLTFGGAARIFLLSTVTALPSPTP